MAEAAIPLELEAKLLVPSESDFRRIGRLTALAGFRLRPRAIQRLHSVYFDTTEFVLARYGVALRVRRHGRAWEATAKWAGRIEGDVHERQELTVSLPGPPGEAFVLPAGPLATYLVALVAHRPLRPILVTDILRRCIDVVAAEGSDSGGAVAELALDRVRLHGPAAARPPVRAYREVEIEQRGGTRADVEALALALRECADVLPSSQSKFGRGLALLYGREPSGAAAPTPVLATDSVGQAARKLIDRHLAALRANDPGTRLGQNPEALHDMRVATQRLRAMLRALSAGFPARLRGVLTRELRWLTGRLGPVRDLDVQLEKFDRLAAVAPPGHRAALGPLREFVQAERAARRAEMLSALDSKRYSALLVRLERVAYGPASPAGGRGGAESLAAVGERAVARTFKKLRRRGDAVELAPTPEDLHALRIRAKRLRYLLEFLRDISGRPGRRLIKRLVRLQDLLGAYNDAVVAADSVRRYVDEKGVTMSPSALLTVGAVVGSDLRVAEQMASDLDDVWQRFANRRTVEDIKRLVRRLRSFAAANAGKVDVVPETVSEADAPAPADAVAPAALSQATGEPGDPEVTCAVPST